MQIERVRLSVRLNTVFFPLGLDELVVLLQGAGYSINPAVLQEPLRPRLSLRVEGSGQIARRGELTVDLHGDRGILGVDGKDIAEVTAEFEALEGLIAEKLDLKLPKLARFYETIITGYLSVREDVREGLRRLSEKIPIFDNLSDVWGAPITNFGLRLVPKNGVPNSEQWLDIRIEPNIVRFDSYAFEAVFRDPERTKVNEFMRNLPGRLAETSRIILEQQ